MGERVPDDDAFASAATLLRRLEVRVSQTGVVARQGSGHLTIADD
jgi:hypothetical protein